MRTLHTAFGDIPVAEPEELHPDGTLRACLPAEPCVLATPLGPLTPQHSTDDVRRKIVQAVEFYADGGLRSMALETRTTVPTPLGPLPAEFVTFHPCGAVHRVFPLNGKLSGYWSQEDEASLAEPLDLPTPLGPVRAKVICVRFDAGGQLAGVTLWPGESVTVPTPVGPVPARIGIRFWPGGALRSLEPAEPVSVPTPVGEIRAYDPDAVGISGDDNSLAFDPSGALVRVSTVQSVLRVERGEGTRAFTPASRESLCGDADSEPVPMVLEFSPGRVAVRPEPGAPAMGLDLAGARCSVTPHLPQLGVVFAPPRCGV